MVRRAEQGAAGQSRQRNIRRHSAEGILGERQLGQRVGREESVAVALDLALKVAVALLDPQRETNELIAFWGSKTFA